VAAERTNTGRFIVHAHEKLTAFCELEAAIRNSGVHSKLKKKPTPTARRTPLSS
jgi:hypothetical protein